MQKSAIDMERRGKWWWLRKAVYEQYVGTFWEYNIDGNMKGATNAVYKVADKYGFRVNITTDTDTRSIVVYKELL